MKIPFKILVFGRNFENDTVTSAYVNFNGYESICV